MVVIAATAATLLAVLTGPMAYLAPMGMTPLVGFVALALFLAAWPAMRATEQGAGGRVLRAGRAVWPLLAVGLASVLWSLEPSASAYKSGQIAILVLFGLVLVPALGNGSTVGATRVLAAAAVGFLAITPLILADIGLDGALTGWVRPVPEGALAASYSRGAAAHALFSLPLAIGLWRTGHRRLAVAVMIVAPMPFALEQTSAQLALVAGLVAAVAIFAVPRLRWLLLAGQIMFVLAVPLVLPYDNLGRLCTLIDSKASVIHRVTIWNFALDRWAEKPVAGWGLATSRFIPGGQGYADFMTPCGRAVGALPDGTTNLPRLLPLHTHNAAVQIWLELGAVGALALAWLVASLSFQGYARATDRMGKAAVAGLSSSAFVVAVVSFGAWQSWWWATIVLAIGLTAAALQSNGGRPSAGAR